APSRNSFLNFLRFSGMTLPHRSCLHGNGGYPPDRYHRASRAQREEIRCRQVAELTDLVWKLLGIGAHAEINFAIKASHRAGHSRSRYDWSAKKRLEWIERKDCCASPALLAGRHDVDNFVERLVATEHKEWVEVIKRLARELLCP
ncbi:MAG: hypothetical protein ACYCZV_17805, partial [Acidimicrobiales bacterium]